MNAVAFSIYGSDPKYVEGAVRNAECVPKAYPGFTAVFYLDTRTTPSDLSGRLRALGAEVRAGDSADGTLPEDRMLWKLLAIDDPQMDVILFRDADSRITRREVAAVSEWLASDMAAHVMRDFPNHACRVGGGLWGIRMSKMRGFPFRKHWEEYKTRYPGWKSEYRWNDQTFLAEVVWPNIEERVMQHDEFSGYPGTRPFPTTFDPAEGYVGEIFDGQDQPIQEHRIFRKVRRKVAYMNPDTRIAVCCYAGDQHCVIESLGLYLHHNRPVVVLSPEDSPAEIRYPGIENRFGGKRAYIGQESLDRQHRHLKMLLDFPENHFLVHDADSLCLSPELPRYLYDQPDVLWSNLVNDGIPGHADCYPSGFPRVAFQPPYFLSRGVIEKLVAVAGGIIANPCLPFIDHYMVQLAVAAGVPYSRFEKCVSIATQFRHDATDGHSEESPYYEGIKHMEEHIRGGANFIHSVKKSGVRNMCVGLWGEYANAHP